MDEFIRPPKEELEMFRFNDLTDYDIGVGPATVWEELNQFNVEAFDERLQLHADEEKKCFIIEEKDENDQLLYKVKAKFFELE